MRGSAWVANLAPGEALAPGTADALDALFVAPDVDAALLPLVPEGAGAWQRAARTYLARWDARFVHRMNFYAPASRTVTRAPLPGPRNADAAPALAASIDHGRRVEALPAHGVVSPIARDLGTWVGAFREEGRAWGALAAREPRFAPFLPALDARGWWRHNLQQMPRRTIEVFEAVREPRALPWALHALREAAFTRGCVAGAKRRTPPVF